LHTLLSSRNAGRFITGETPTRLRRLPIFSPRSAPHQGLEDCPTTATASLHITGMTAQAAMFNLRFGTTRVILKQGFQYTKDLMMTLQTRLGQ